MTNEEWINMFINKFNESKDYKITDVRDREKLLDELRPTGSWIIVDDCEHFIAKCSICGRIEDSRMVKNYPFCRCGARMKGEEE